MENNVTDYLDEVAALRAEREPEIAGQWEATKIVLQIRKEREDRGITQAQVAERMGVSQPHVVRIERKPWAASFARILAYAHAVGVDIAPVEKTKTAA